MGDISQAAVPPSAPKKARLFSEVELDPTGSPVPFDFDSADCGEFVLFVGFMAAPWILPIGRSD
jgi:hypothetical protein